MEIIPACVYGINDQIGDGVYHMIACFPNWGVHVPFTFIAHSENEYLKNVGEPTPCDGSCSIYSKNLKDFSRQTDNTGYERAAIVEKAEAFYKNMQNP